MKKIAFRVDAGPSIGSGHLMRCYALAEEFAKEHVNVSFITRFPEYIEDLISGEFDLLPLGRDEEVDSDNKGWDYGNSGSLEWETDRLKNIIRNHAIEMLLIDSYNVNENYFIELKKFVPKLCYIDDLNRFKFAVDVIINGNVYADRFKYSSHLPNTKYLTGTEYTILRSEFKDIKPISITDLVERIIITLGGSDPLNQTRRIVDIINSDRNLQEYEYNVIIGKGFKKRDELMDCGGNKIIFHENISNMAEFMLKSDIALCGGGGTLYEFARCGVPALAIIVAENQEMVVDSMYDLGCIDKIGWYNKATDNEIRNKLISLIQAPSVRRGLNENCQKLFDGLGAERAVREIMSMIKT